MKNIVFRIAVIVFLTPLTMSAQEFKTPPQEYKVGNNEVIFIEASYAEIEIEEWNKNKVEIQGIMSVQGLPENEAQGLFDAWDINTQITDNGISIRSSSSNIGNEYFFIHSDKYLGNVVVDIPEISTRVSDILDSVHFILPEIENFPDIDFDAIADIQEININHESIVFDYEAFQKDSDYLKEWQEMNKETLDRLKAEIKESQKEMAVHQKEMHREMAEMREEAMVEARLQAEEMREHAREEARHVREEARVQAREYEVQRIIDKRQRLKIKKTLRIKVPKNAKLEMDVDYCKITTIK